MPPPGNLPYPGIKPRSPALQTDSLSSESPGKPSRDWASGNSGGKAARGYEGYAQGSVSGSCSVGWGLWVGASVVVDMDKRSASGKGLENKRNGRNITEHTETETSKSPRGWWESRYREITPEDQGKRSQGKASQQW